MPTKNKYSQLKKAVIVLLLLVISFATFIIIANRNNNMTNRQKLLNALYPVIMWFTKATGSNTTVLSDITTKPVVPVYNLSMTGINGELIHLNDFKGKKILFVNTASDCGYTAQYAQLEKLFRLHRENLVILGFPANDFKEQEKGTDKDIAAFCKANFSVSFPLLQKSSVVKSANQNEVFKWLTDKNKNGWNDQAPTWNFCKYLVDENGKLIHFYASSVDPMGSELLHAINSR